MPERIISYSAALHEGLQQAMLRDERVIVIGEGVPDPKAIFGTTEGLQEQFGKQRVFDMPLSENGLTGICIGAALGGMRPLLIHQRVDFALLSMDPIINHAAKWRFLFGQQAKTPLVIRALIGRGWGQGPQHAQSLQALFAHIPGLRVVMPANGSDAKGMLSAALSGNDPVLILEHRWLHHTLSPVASDYFTRPLEGASVVRKGQHVTIAAFSHMVIEAHRAADWLSEQGIEVEIIDLRVVRPLDMHSIIRSTQHTGRLLVLDTAWKTGGISAEILAQIAEQCWGELKAPPQRLALPDLPSPTAAALADAYYPEAEHIAAAILTLMKKTSKAESLQACSSLRRADPRDVPNAEFCGPF